MGKKWMEAKGKFERVDVRTLSGNFLPMIMKKAELTEEGNGLCVIQSFEPKPLYSALGDLGFDHEMVKVSDEEYHVYFYRMEKVKGHFKGGGDMPLKPTAIVNFKAIDDHLANTVVDFWEQIWDDENAAIDKKTKLLLSLSNAVGARRFRQATRELVKAYAIGVTIKEFDELFALFTWNQGVGFFASEIGPSTLFRAYKFIKKKEAAGVEHGAILAELLEKFGDKNPEVQTF